jgi:protein O-GlcNAc transferase
MSVTPFELSVQYLQAGHYDHAEETLRGLLRVEGGNVAAWCLLGRIRQGRGRPDEALALFQQAGRIDPDNADVYNLSGSALALLGQAEAARDCLEQALRLNPFHPEAYNNLGKVHLLNQSAGEALACFREAVRLQSNHVEALHNLALVLVGLRQFDEARPLVERVVQLAPQFAGGQLGLSALCFERGDYEAALAAAHGAAKLDPNLAAAPAQIGAVLLKMGRSQEALAPLESALRLAPQHVQANEHLGLALLNLGRREEALNHLQRAAELDANNVRILVNLATVLVEMDRGNESAALTPRLLQLNPPAELLHNLGLAYLKKQRPDLALSLVEQALRLRPNDADLLHTLGWALHDGKQYARAEETLRQALRIRPEFPQALDTLGLVCAALEKRDEACACHERAVHLQPDFAQAWGRLANVYRDVGRIDDALACYRKALALDPSQDWLYSNFLFYLHYSPQPTADEIFHEHLAWARRHAAASQPRRHANDRDPQRRLRIGYVSADFRDHVMGRYLELVLESHDRAGFECYCYSNLDSADHATERIQHLADRWRVVHNVADDEMEKWIREDGIDLLIDLSGHTGGNRLPLFARKPAPVQVGHFGYMETTGLAALDYRLTDAVCDPPGQTERYHTERLVRLPEIAWCYRPYLEVEVNDVPAAARGAIAFGMLNTFPKISPPALASWAAILRRTPGSRLLLLAGISPQADRRLLDAFAAHGIAAERLVLQGRCSRPDYFRLFHEVDVALDSFPYAGCNTTCDALWMGVPVVTLAGQTCMARQGASPLAHLGLHDLITQTPEDYENAAVRLAADLPRLKELRATLRPRMQRSTLMNPSRFTRQLEEAYRGMWRQWCRTGV